MALASISSAAHITAFWRKALVPIIATLGTLLTLLTLGVWLTIALRRERIAQSKLSDALAQNKVLFQEIHHRVKNNLQMVSALIRLQPIDKQIKSDMDNRISAMAAIQEQAYRAEQYKDVSLSEYLKSLIDNFRHLNRERVTIDARLEPVVATRDIALPLGLLVNELLTNSIKHAFPESSKGTIDIQLSMLQGNRAQIIIKDDGVGYFQQQASSASGIGSRLINGFVSQLRGDLNITSVGGTMACVTFPLIVPTT